MNVLLSTATKGPEAIERFYPGTSFAQNKSSGYDTDEQQSPANGISGINGINGINVINGTNGINGESNRIPDRPRAVWISSDPVVLVDWVEDVFFLDVTIWLVEMGIRNLILVSSDHDREQYAADHELMLTHIEKLRNIGVDVHVMQVTLSVANEKDFATEMGMITPRVKGVIFNKDVTMVRSDHPVAFIVHTAYSYYSTGCKTIGDDCKHFGNTSSSPESVYRSFATRESFHIYQLRGHSRRPSPSRWRRSHSNPRCCGIVGQYGSTDRPIRYGQ